MIKRLLVLCWVVGFALTAFCGCQKETAVQDALLTVNGQVVSEEEYQLFLQETARNFQILGGEDIWQTDFDGRSALDVAKDSAVNSLVAVKVAVQQAQEMGLTLTEEESSAAQQEAEEGIAAYEQVNGPASPETIQAYQQVMAENQLFQKVRQEVVKSYAAGEAEYQAYADNYRENKARQMRHLTIAVLSCHSQEEAQQAADALNEGMDFDDVFEQYNTDPSLAQQNRYEVMEQDLDEGEQVLSGAQKGFVSPPVETEMGYDIYYVEEVTPAAAADVEAALREEFTQVFQNQVFNEILQRWEQNAVIQRDNTRINEVTEAYLEQQASRQETEGGNET